MGSDKEHIITVIHHDAERPIYVTGYDEPGSYLHMLTYYGTDYEKLRTVREMSDIGCRQKMSLQCYGASATVNDWILDSEGRRVPYHFPEGDCRCRLSRACEHNRET